MTAIRCRAELAFRLPPECRIRYTVLFVQSIPRAMVSAASSSAPPALPVTLRISGGYRTSLATDYGTAVSVPNGRFATFRVTLQPAMANASVRFYQRIGNTGAWTFLSTGWTDASGTVVWSKVVKVTAGARDYDRYVYFRVMVPQRNGSTSWSDAVRAVAK